MTTLSLLKNKEESSQLKIRLAFNREEKYHSQYEWFKQEYTKWSKNFPDYRENFKNQVQTYVGLTFNSCHTKERLLNIAKVIDFFFHFDNVVEECRKKRSDKLMEQLVEKILSALNKRQCDPNFAIGMCELFIFNL